MLITCVYTNDSINAFIVVAHKKSMYLHSTYGLLNIQVFQFHELKPYRNRKEISGCIENVSESTYHFVVLPYNSRTLMIEGMSSFKASGKHL